ncbi:MAG TPA: Rnase Y domain-containing protein, partial [bacterium]|nr:Rnase Y domain-containing protein [bacterium]
MLQAIYIGIGSLFLGGAAATVYFVARDRWFISNTRREAQRLLEEAKSESERIEKESKIQLKEQMLHSKMEIEREIKDK